MYVCVLGQLKRCALNDRRRWKNQRRFAEKNPGNFTHMHGSTIYQNIYVPLSHTLRLMHSKHPRDLATLLYLRHGWDGKYYILKEHQKCADGG